MINIGGSSTHPRVPRLLLCFGLILILALHTKSMARDTDVPCPAPTAPVVKIEAMPFYQAGDATNSQIDREKLRENTRLTQPITRFLDTLGTLSDNYVQTRSADVKQCADGFLYRWARAGALKDISQGSQAGFVQKWSLASLGFLRMKLGPLRDSSQDAVVRNWMRDLAASVANIYRGNGGPNRNNHYYWAMLALAVVGHSTDDPTLWARAEEMDRFALADIQTDGTLPAELKRIGRAAWYHAFAAEPLVLFKLVNERCRNQPHQNDERLNRLLEVVHDALNGSPTLRTITGIEQTAIQYRNWVNLWDALEEGQPYIVTRARERNLGGSVDVLYRFFLNGCHPG